MTQKCSCSVALVELEFALEINMRFPNTFEAFLDFLYHQYCHNIDLYARFVIIHRRRRQLLNNNIPIVVFDCGTKSILRDLITIYTAFRPTLYQLQLVVSKTFKIGR